MPEMWQMVRKALQVMVGFDTTEESSYFYQRNHQHEQVISMNDFEFQKKIRKQKNERQELQQCVYFVQSGVSGPVKVGMTNNTAKRIESLQIGNHQKLHLIGKIATETKADSRLIEKQIHRANSNIRLLGEWFQPSIIDWLWEHQQNLVWDGRCKSYQLAAIYERMHKAS